jgi:hypothetical protein
MQSGFLARQRRIICRFAVQGGVTPRPYVACKRIYRADVSFAEVSSIIDPSGAGASLLTQIDTADDEQGHCRGWSPIVESGSGAPVISISRLMESKV